MNERLEATVHGFVQGVGFRWFAVHQAARLGLTGWVSNETDGSVRIVAEGPPAVLRMLIAALEAGPAGARVERVEQRHAPATGEFASFGIRPGAHPGD